MKIRNKSDGTLDMRCFAGRPSQEASDKRAMEEIGPRIAELNAATIAFRLGTITQEEWLAVRASIIGEDCAVPEPHGAYLEKESGIREYYTKGKLNYT